MENYLMENYKIESKVERLNRLVTKFQKEREHFQRLVKKGLHPLEIADRLIHNMFVSMRIGLENKYKKASKEEIHNKMKELVKTDIKIKNLRKKLSNGRN